MSKRIKEIIVRYDDKQSFIYGNTLGEVVGELLRCKECKYYDNEDYGEPTRYCTWHESVVNADDFCSYGEPKTQMKTQNSNLTFKKDECVKEYEELGLKELKELIEADGKERVDGNKIL